MLVFIFFAQTLGKTNGLACLFSALNEEKASFKRPSLVIIT